MTYMYLYYLYITCISYYKNSVNTNKHHHIYLWENGSFHAILENVPIVLHFNSVRIVITITAKITKEYIYLPYLPQVCVATFPVIVTEPWYFFMILTSSSLAAQAVNKSTTSGAASDGEIGIKATLYFQWLYLFCVSTFRKTWIELREPSPFELSVW